MHYKLSEILFANLIERYCKAHNITDLNGKAFIELVEKHNDLILKLNEVIRTEGTSNLDKVIETEMNSIIFQ